MKIETNLADHYRKDIILFLCKFSQYNNDKSFKEISREDVLQFLDKLNGVQISGSSFTVTGTELSMDGAVSCTFSQLPTSVTISGQCGTGVTI